MSLTFLRRKSLGAGSVKGMVGHLLDIPPEEVSALSFIGNPNVIRNDKLQTVNGGIIKDNTSWLVRWGCTTEFGFPNDKTINISKAIKCVADKRGFRKKIAEVDESISPHTIFSLDDRHNIKYPVVLRSAKHSQGKNLWLVESAHDLVYKVNHTPALQNGWYASEYINKVSEHRIYIVSGRVVTIANKTPDNPNNVAWNVAQGGSFSVVKWGDWDIEAMKVALDAFKLSGLDFGGVDIMTDAMGRSYVIEINSAPSLPIMVEGKSSYRQVCMAKAFKYIEENGKESIPIKVGGSWKNYIHPAISDQSIV